MKNDEIQAYQQALVQRKAHLSQRITLLTKDKLRKVGALSTDIEEQAQEIENDEVIDTLEDMELLELKQIDTALTRIKNGEFGVCASCGRRITDSRLKAVPYAANCLKCAS